MRSRLKQYFYNPVCLKCGSFFVEDHLYCETCFNHFIVPRIGLKTHALHLDSTAVEHFYLFEWRPGESDLLSRMVYCLKSDKCERALRFYSRILAIELQHDKKFEQLNGSDYLLLPLPGSKKSSVHSHIMADELKWRLDASCADLFTKNANQVSQKEKNRKERRQTSVLLKEDAASRELITSLRTQRATPVYVDDILTTGSTLQSARKALHLPEDRGQITRVLTLFYRPSKAQT